MKAQVIQDTAFHQRVYNSGWLEGQDYPGVYSISFIQALGCSEEFDGKIVELTGYLNLAFESKVLYLHQEDASHGITKNGLWIYFSDNVEERIDYKQFSGKYVKVFGRLNLSKKGHEGMCSGSIENVYMIIAK